MNKAIQFIGTQRSGSNLLRLILNQHKQISAPHPPHLLKTFVPLLPHYQLEDPHYMKNLVEDMCQWVETNPVPWTDISLDREKILNNSSSIYDIFEQIYLAKAGADKSEFWCCKSTFNIQYVEELEKRIKPFYIHLYRDGRDVAASFKKVVVGHKHAYHLALQWHEEQVLSLEFLKEIEEKRKIHISYEALLDHPKMVATDICNKLGIDYSDEMLLYYTSEESKHTAESGRMWERVTQPIIRDNHDKFPNELTLGEIRIIEQVAGSTLKALNYELTQPDDGKMFLDIDQYNILNQEYINQWKSKISKDKLNRMDQNRLLEVITKRLDVPYTQVT
jgi:hypothetical protein